MLCCFGHSAATKEASQDANNKKPDGAGAAPQGTAHQRMTALLTAPVPHSAVKLLLEAGQIGPGTATPEPGGTKRAHDSTFSVLASQRNRSEAPLSPQDLQELRSARRLLEVCSTPAAMLRDIAGLKYISRGASCVVFQGLWQCSEVAIKLMVSQQFNASSASVREALLGSELAHPNLVQNYAMRCLELTDTFLAASKADHDAQQELRRSMAGNATHPDDLKDPAGWLLHSFDSEDGFGPAPAPPTPTPAMQQALGIMLHPGGSAGSGAAAGASMTPSNSDAMQADDFKHSGQLPLVHQRTRHGNGTGAPGESSWAAIGAATGTAPSESEAPLGNGFATAHLSLTRTTPADSSMGGSRPAARSLPGHDYVDGSTRGSNGVANPGVLRSPAGAGSSHRPASRAPSNSSLVNRIRLHSRNGTAAYMLPAHNPWLNGATWYEVLTALKAQPGQVLMLLVQELCDLGVLSWAVHKKRLFVPAWRDPRKLALRALLRTAREVALGLNHLHEAGVVHGDLKPANVVLMSSRLDRRGFVAKLTDLGLSRVLAPRKSPFEARDMEDGGELEVITDAEWGTTIYMAPEHLRGQLCKASDIYSWGVMVWEMAHACRPYEGMKREDIVTGVLQGMLRLPWDPALPADLIRLCRACLSHAPSARPSVHAVIAQVGDIEAALRDEIRSTRLPTRMSGVLQPAPAAAAPPGGLA